MAPSSAYRLFLMEQWRRITGDMNAVLPPIYVHEYMLMLLFAALSFLIKVIKSAECAVTLLIRRMDAPGQDSQSSC
jgi:hypothetical protein